MLELQSTDGSMQADALESAYLYSTGDSDDVRSYIENGALLTFAIANLVKSKAVIALSDPFGPSQFIAGPNFQNYIASAGQDTNNPTKHEHRAAFLVGCMSH